MPSRLLYAASMLACMGCEAKSAAEIVAEHDRSRLSWEQTARFAAEEWIKGTVPDAFATRTLERTRDELSSEQRALAKDSLSSSDRRRLSDALGVTRSLADTLLQSIRGGDRARAARSIAPSPRPHEDSLLRAAELR